MTAARRSFEEDTLDTARGAPLDESHASLPMLLAGARALLVSMDVEIGIGAMLMTPARARTIEGAFAAHAGGDPPIDLCLGAPEGASASCGTNKSCAAWHEMSCFTTLLTAPAGMHAPSGSLGSRPR